MRLLLVILCGTAIAGAGYFLWSSTQTAAREAEALRRFDTSSRTARVGLADLRAAQQSYVAAGQGEAFWFDRVSVLAKAVEDAVTAMRASAATAEAGTALDAAGTALQEFMQMDLRARDYTRNRHLTLASDMIFADGLELTKKADAAIDRAVTAEQVTYDAGSARIRREQAAALAGAAAISLLSLGLLAPGRRGASEKEAEAAGQPPASMKAASTGVLGDLRDLDLVARPAPPPPKPGPPPAPARVSHRADLDLIASICSELARVPDTRALPALLQRTAAILDASVVVLWIADPDGRELAPILVHGYPSQLVVRLGTILRDAENVTASAYRTGLLQTMKADTISSGAIAVPLISPHGCVGVMAAEMKNGGEQQESLLAAARIIAAQLATLVGPPAARAKAEAAS